jgi:preprotein translocase subunit YajC
MTQSGLYGTLTALDKNTAELKLADNMVIMIDRFSIKNKVADPAKLKETAE